MPSEEERSDVNIEVLVSEQNKILKEINQNLVDEELEERALRKLGRLLGKSITLIFIGVGALLGSWEFGIWTFEQWQSRKAAKNYANIASQLYFEENNPKVAKSFVQKAINLQDRDINYLYLDAYIDGMSAVRKLFNLDRPYTAEELNDTYEAFAKASFLEQISPNNSGSFILKAQIYTALKDYKRAKKEIDDAIKIDPKNDFAYVRKGVIEYLSKDTSTALKSLDYAIELNADSKWAYLWKGIIFADKSKLEAALGNYEKALTIDPRFDLGYYNRGWISLKKRPQDYSQAEKDFNKALSLNPSYKEAFYGLGMVYGYQDKYEISERYFTKAIKIDKTYLTAIKWRGIVYDELKRYDKALKDFSNVLSIDPGNLDIFIRRARVYRKKKDFDGALSDLMHVIDKGGVTRRVQYYISQIYYESGQFNNSLMAINKALAIDSKYAAGYAWRAKVLGKTNKVQAALEDFGKAIKFAKYKKERYYFYKARYLKSRGEVEKSIQLLEECLLNNKKYIPGLLLMAEIYRSQNQRNLSNDYLNRVLAIQPQNRLALKIMGRSEN